MTLGSVEHEGTTTRMSCQASHTSAFTSSCTANLGSLCLGPPRHHCLQPPHGVENFTVFCMLLLALGSTFANLSSVIPVFLAWHCAFHALASFDAAWKSLPRCRLALAWEAERWCSSSVSRVASLHLVPVTLSFAYHTAFYCGR